MFNEAPQPIAVSSSQETAWRELWRIISARVLEKQEKQNSKPFDSEDKAKQESNTEDVESTAAGRVSPVKETL